MTPPHSTVLPRTSAAHPTDGGAPSTPVTGTEARRARRAGRAAVWLRRPDRGGLSLLLLATAALYLWDLGASGWANSFYAAAAQAGSESWQAFFFGSSDAANSITVDKTPLSLWPMALSIRIFGLSSWSLLVPQALEGVAAVWLLYATVRRTTRSAGAGLLAGAILALTPVAALMFRFDNPDALLVLLMVAAAGATLRATEPGSRHARWLALAGTLVGLAFLTKMLQAFLVLPALGLTYLLCAAGVAYGRRMRHLVIGFAAMVLAGGWWVAIVELWPASARPYIGGSQNDSILELTLGYNGLGRLTGDETGSVGGGAGGGGGMWGETGWVRMFGSEVGAQIAWLMPAALLLGVAALWLSRRHPADAESRRALRAGVTLWLGWLVVTGLTFSFMAGIFHAYYTVALAPAIVALVAIGCSVAWRQRDRLPVAVLLGVTMAFTTGFTYTLLARVEWQPWLKYVVAVVGFAVSLALVLVRLLPGRLARVVAAVAVAAALAGPAAYTVQTVATPHSGSIVSAGPTGSAGGPGGFGGGPGGGFGGTPPTQNGTPPTGGQTGQTGQPGLGGTGGGTGGTGGGGGGMGSLLNGSDPGTEITRLLETDADSYTWVAAAVGSNTASGYQLATEDPVMAIGGFNGSDPSPTLAEFEELVANGEIHYFIGGGQLGGQQNGGSEAASEIAAWVSANFEARTVDGVTVYDLSGGVR